MKRFLTLLCVTLLVVSLTVAPGGSQDTAEAVEVRIVRDGYGVPHVYSDTDEGVAYGAGYAIAVDRLFQLEVLRALAKGRFVELFGPIPGFEEMDASARRLFYTNDERREKLTRLSFRAQRLYAAYVDGINDRMAEVRSNPSLLPQEYTTFGLGVPQGWDVTDSLAIAEFLVESFGAGGGSELAQAELLKFLQAEFGDSDGLAAFDDIRWLNDPASPPSIPPDFEWETSPTFAEDLPEKQWRRDARIGLSATERAPIAFIDQSPPPQPAIGTQPQADLVPDEPSETSMEQLDAHVAGIEQAREFFSFGSNAFVTSPERTASGGTVQLGGPQVGQFVPQIIAEWGLHTTDGSWDMMGLTFAGAGPAVLIGRTPFFAWTTTTGNSDGADVYVVELGPDEEGDGFDPHTYVWEGGVYRMDCRDETINDRGGVPLRSVEVCRTRHGPVLSVDEENGVAYAIRRAWFDYEVGTIEGFFGANFVNSVGEFATEINRLQSNHNMFYVDADGNYGYWHPGALPIRASGTDVRLPQDGRFAATEWQRMRTAQEVPHAVNFDRGWLANWNNKPAVSWDNGDGANYGAVFRNQVWNDLLAAEPAMSLARGEEFNRINGTTELEFAFFRDHIVDAGRASDDEQIRAAAEVLATWDARREDNVNNTTGTEPADGLVDSEPGYSLWKGWRALAREMAFADDLGDLAGRSSDSMLLHVLDGTDASLPKNHDWLNGQSVTDFLNAVMRANLDALEAEYGTDDMSLWAADMPQQHYTRLNVRFYDCEVARAGGVEAGCDDNLPGNVREVDFMNRGTYNHLVEFAPGTASGLPELPETGAIVEQRDGAPVGLAGVEPYTVTAESIISPGQSGFINQAGQQDPHYEDQHDLYAEWVYKPMPLREEDVAALGGEDATVLTYEFSLDELVRVAGPNRIATAVAASTEAFESAAEVVVASAGDFPDALAAAPLAGTERPLLLVGDRLDDTVRAELERLGATSAVIVGGEAAVSAAAEADLVGAGLEVTRIAGADRFATAALVAAEVGADGGEAFLASGRVFADALSAGAVAAGLGIPILLTEPEALPQATADAITELELDTVLLLGGQAAVGPGVEAELRMQELEVTRLAGADRYETSQAVASFGADRGLGAADVWVATGTAFPDGLAGGPAAAAGGALLLLVDGANPDAATPAFGFLANAHATVERVLVLGGTAAIGTDTATRAQLAASQR